MVTSRAAPPLLDGSQGCRSRCLASARDAVSPPAAERPEVGAELAGVAKLRSGAVLLELEVLDDVRDRPPDEAEVDAARPLEANGLERGRDGTPDLREVLGEHHVFAALDHVQLGSRGRAGFARGSAPP